MRGAHGRESDAWWSISCLIVLGPGVIRRPLIEPLPDTEGVATPGYCFTYSTVLGILLYCITFCARIVVSFLFRGNVLREPY